MAVVVLMSNYDESEQHVFDAIKSISRNKQRRISSVAHEIITKHDRAYQPDSIPTLSASSLQSWPTHNITIQQR